MNLKDKILEKGIFVKFRLGKKPFNPVLDTKKTTAFEDIVGRRGENDKNKLEGIKRNSKKNNQTNKGKEEGLNEKTSARIVDCGVIVSISKGTGL